MIELENRFDNSDMVAAALFVLIQLDHRVATVEAVVAELAAKSGQKLKIRREMQDEFLYINLKPRSTKELMALVARAASAEWIEGTGRLDLGRSGALQKRQIKADQTAFGTDVAQRLKPFLSTVRTGTTTVTEKSDRDPTANYRHKLGLSPAGRLMARLLASLPSDNYGIPTSGSISRWSLRPNRRQMPLPSSASGYLRQYVSERASLLNELNALPRAKREETMEARGLGFLAFDRPTNDPRPILIEQRGRGGDVTFRLILSDAAGHVIDATEDGLPLYQGFRTDSLARHLPDYQVWKDQPVATTPAARDFLNASNDLAEPIPSRALVHRDPVVHEPLAELMTAPLDALTAAVGKETILAVPDDTATDAGDALLDKPTLGPFADGIARSVAFESSEGILIGHARYPSQTVRTKTRRTVLRDMMGLVATRYPRLADLTRYAFEQTMDSSLSGFEWKAFAAAGLPVRSISGYPPSFLRLYGSLSEVQQIALKRGIEVPFSRLSSGTQQIAERWIFDQSEDVDRNLPMGKIERVDPTLIADSLLPQGSLFLSNLQEKLVVSWSHQEGTRVTGSDFLGSLLANEEREGPVRVRGYPVVSKDRFWPGVQQDFIVQVRLSGNAYARRRLEDVDVDMRGKPMAYTSLPEAHLKELTTRFEKFRNRTASPTRRPGNTPP